MLLGNGLDDIPEINKEINDLVDDLYQKEGLQKCVDELLKLDSKSGDFIELQNPVRVIRALKVIKNSGKPIYEYFNKTKKKRDFNIIYVGINLDRDYLYDRINKRVDIMINEGLVDEARNFIDFQHYNSLNTIGYKEIFNYLNGKYSLNEAIDDIKLNTRHYAKRQMTWFRKNKDINWFENVDTDKIIIFLRSVLYS